MGVARNLRHRRRAQLLYLLKIIGIAEQIPTYLSFGNFEKILNIRAHLSRG